MIAGRLPVDSEDRTRVELSIVIPAYNSGASIAGVIARLADYCRGRGLVHELIVVDDGSGDETRMTLLAAQRQYPELRILRNEPNRGKGYSVRRAYAECAGANVVFTDADLPYGLGPIEAAVTALDAGADLAIGSRVLPESRFRMNARHFPYIFIRHLLGRTLVKTVNLMFRLNVSDTQCGIKACRRSAARYIASRLTIDRFVFDVELLHVARKAGYRIVEIPVELDYTGKVTTVRILRDALFVLFGLWKIKFADWRGRYEPGESDDFTTRTE